MVQLALNIEIFKIVRTLDVTGGQDFDQPDHLLKKVRPTAVQMREQGMDRVKIRAQPGIKTQKVSFAYLRLYFIEYLVEKRM